MKVLFYHSIEDATSRSVGAILASVTPGGQIDICDSFFSLEKQLCRQPSRFALVVIQIQTDEELMWLVQKKNLLEDIRLILIIPDDDPETVQMGHKLYPRFMADKNFDMNHLSAIVKKIFSMQISII